MTSLKRVLRPKIQVQNGRYQNFTLDNCYQILYHPSIHPSKIHHLRSSVWTMMVTKSSILCMNRSLKNFEREGKKCAIKISNWKEAKIYSQMRELEGWNLFWPNHIWRARLCKWNISIDYSVFGWSLSMRSYYILFNPIYPGLFEHI